MTIVYRNIPVPILTIAPNWEQGFKLRDDFNNRVVEMLDTSEERMQRQPRPLITIAYQTLTLTAQESGYVRKVLEQAGDRPCAVGLWQDKLALTVSAAIGNPFVETDPTAGMLFEAGGYVLITDAFNNWEASRILSVSPSGLNLVSGLEKAWLPGAWAVPLLLGKLRKPMARAMTDEVGGFRVDFEEQFLTDQVRLCGVLSGGTDPYFLLAMEQQCTGGPIL